MEELPKGSSRQFKTPSPSIPSIVNLKEYIKYCTTRFANIARNLPKRSKPEASECNAPDTHGIREFPHIQKPQIYFVTRVTVHG